MNFALRLPRVLHGVLYSFLYGFLCIFSMMCACLHLSSSAVHAEEKSQTEQITAEQITAEQITAEQITAEQITAEQITAEQIAVFETHLQGLEQLVTGQSHDHLLATPPAGEQLSEQLEQLEEHLDLLEPQILRLGQERAKPLLQRMRLLRRSLADPSNVLPPVVEPRPVISTGSAFKGFPRGTEESPPNDLCADATEINGGIFFGALGSLPADGTSACSAHTFTRGDVWYRFTAPADRATSIRLLEASHENVILSLHTGCPATSYNQLFCNQPLFEAEAGVEYILRVGNSDGTVGGSFSISMGPAVTVSGRVTDVLGDPVAGAEVSLFNAAGSRFSIASTGDDGTYQLLLRDPGTYFLGVTSETHVDMFYGGGSCETIGGCVPPTAIPLPLDEGEQREGVDLVLQRLGRVLGKITDANTGEPIPFARVLLQETGVGFYNVSTVADEQGNYTGYVNEGEHLLLALATGYGRDVYQGNCANDCDPAGKPVSVTLNSDTVGIDISLAPLGRIAGRVTNSLTGAPIPFADIYVGDDPEGTVHEQADINGEYIVGGLSTDNHHLRAFALQSFAGELYEEMPCFHCDPRDGTDVPVLLDTTTEGIDFTLDPSGVISGTLVDVATGTPLARGGADLYGSDGRQIGTVETNHRGKYTFPQVLPGTYYVVGGAEGYRSELWLGTPCPCEAIQGTPIEVAPGATVSNIDFSLRRQGSIAGRITVAATRTPLASARVRVWDAEGHFVQTALADSQGRYQVAGLEPGSYTLAAFEPAFLAEVYANQSCPGANVASCDALAGQKLEVDFDQIITGVNFALERLGSISGSVRNASGELLTNVPVRLYDAEGLLVGTVGTYPEGSFHIEGLLTGTYFAVTEENALGYINQVWRGAPCGEEDCDPLAGAPISVQAGSTTVGVNFVLNREGAIFGQVRDARVQLAIEGLVTVKLWDSGGNPVAETFQGSGGYAFTKLEPGTYFLGTQNTVGFIDQLYGGTACPLAACDPTTGTSVQVGFNRAATDVDFYLDPMQGITGRVYDEATGRGIPGIQVHLLENDGYPYTETFANERGEYLLAVPRGRFRLATSVFGGSYTGVNEVYNDVPCEFFSCSMSEALKGDVVEVQGNTITTIDFALTGEFCREGPDTHCLLGDRFRVRADGRDLESNYLGAQARPLTNDTGAFYFFNEDNLELVVKVIDACTEPFNSYWVFAAGLTNLEVEIEVVDSYTNEVRFYENRPGNPFQLVRDTNAFATCHAASAAHTHQERAAARVEAERLRLELDLLSLQAGERPEGVVAKASESCSPGATHLCLAEARFQVEAFWRSPAGAAGTAEAASLGADSGYFWFFGPNNVEVLVKVIDACSAEDFESFWVFAAGLTDLEVTLRITDTVSGEERVYINPQGTPFAPVLDTAAFRTCP